MERKEGRKGQLPIDSRRELGRCGKGNRLFDMELQAYKRLFTEDENMDENYKILLTALFAKEKNIILSQKMKRDDKLNLPLLPTMKFKRSEQPVRRGQCLSEPGDDARREFGRVLIQNDKDDVAFKERCKLSNKKRAGFEIQKKQKGKGLLIHYVDVDVHEVVGKGCKKQNGKERLVEPGDVREDSEKTKFDLEKKRKGKGLLVEPDDYDVGENDVVHDVVRKDSEKTKLEPHKQDSKHRLTSENDEVLEKEFELEKKRKGKGLLVEPDDCDVGEDDRYNAVCEIGGKKSKEISGTASKERSELNRERNDKDSGYEIFLKLMEEYNQTKNGAISKNAATVKIEEGIVSNKDNEPEPKKDVELPNQVPNIVKKLNVEKSRNGEKVQAEVEKRSARRSGNEDEDKNAEIEKLQARRSRKVVFKEYSSKEDKDERYDIEKSPSREFGKFAMEKPKKKRTEADIEKRMPRRSGKFEGIGIKKRPAYQSRETVLNESMDEYNRETIEKNSSRDFRNIAMKKSKNDKARPDIEKSSSRRSSKVIYSDEDEDVRIEKHSSQEFQSVTIKKSKNQHAEPDFVKRSCRKSREVVYKDYSSEEDEDLGIEKCPDRQSKKSISEEFSDRYVREGIKKRASREDMNIFKQNPKNKKAVAEMDKCSSRRRRKVIYSSNEDEDENVAFRVKKHPARQSREAAMDNSSDEDDDGNTEIEKHSSHKFRNVVMKKPKEEKLTTEIDKRAAHEYRKVVMKRPRGEEDVEEEVKRFRDFLLMRSRYGIEEEVPHGDMNFRVGESSVRFNKIDEDSPEEDEKSSDNDSDVEILGEDECLKGPFVPSTRFRNPDVQNYRLSDEYIEFRRQALEVISKPYDKSEYKDHLEEFKGRSYPGYHQDLVEKLKENRWNPRKRLAILRGFFFWLQNLTRVGSFKPWHDDVCLRVEPVRLPKNNGPW